MSVKIKQTRTRRVENKCSSHNQAKREPTSERSERHPRRRNAEIEIETKSEKRGEIMAAIIAQITRTKREKC